MKFKVITDLDDWDYGEIKCVGKWPTTKKPAIQASIDKWRAVVDSLEGGMKEIPFANEENCSLCHLYLNGWNNCAGCPIYEKTGRQFCQC